MRNPYEFEALPSKIPPEEAIEIGKQLIAEGYRIVSSYTVLGDNNLTVRGLLKEFDKGTTSEGTTEERLEANGQVVGPYYSVDNTNEYYYPGIAVWARKSDHT